MGMAQALAFILGALATARLTRLVTTDRITQAPRVWALKRLPEDSLLAYLIVCDWCVSIYVAAAVTTAWVTVGESLWYQAPAAALALSYAAGFLQTRSGD